MFKKAVALALSLLLVAPLPVLAWTSEPAPHNITTQTTSEQVKDVQRVVRRVISTTARTVPTATDYASAFNVTCGYPEYNQSFSTKVTSAGGNVATEKAAVLEENTAILDYTSIDASGNLYKDGVQKTATADGKTVTKLIRHTAGVNNYGTAVSDSAQATNTWLSLRCYRYGNVATGLFAPPGELIKVTFKSTSSDTPAKDLGLVAEIGNFSASNHYRDIPGTSEFVRMPKNDVTLKLDQEVNYIGSPLGGPIYIYSNGIGGTSVQMEIEGAVEMCCWRLGEDSDAELSAQLAKPGPYFVFSTPRGLRFSGPSSILSGLTATQIKRALEYWDKAVSLSSHFEAGGFDYNNPDNTEMCELYEPYIPAGAAVNLGGAYCVCPVGWGASALNADTLIGEGAWGNIHEINHSYYWGGATDDAVEIANNVISSLTYQLYSNIAANRTETGGLTGWNWCTDSYYTLEKIRTKSGKRDNLEVYVPVQQAFGADVFLDCVHRYHEAGGKAGALSGNARNTNSNVWLYATSKATGYDMTYYMRDVLRFNEYASAQTGVTDYLTTPVVNEVKGAPVYIPSGCLYASGFVYGEGTASEATVEMGRPFRIPAGASKTLDFRSVSDGGYVSVANGESVQYVRHTQPKYGTLATTSDPLVFTYTPSSTQLEDSFTVTVKLTVTDTLSSYVGSSQEVTYKVSLLQESASTPAIGSHNAEKRYFMRDPSLASTSLTSEFESVTGALSAKRVWDLTLDHALAFWGGSSDGSNSSTNWPYMVDNDLTTHFHGRVEGSTSYEAEFVFELPTAETFNTLRYKGHASANDRGKVKTYEVYVGNDYDTLLAAGTSSALCVDKGTGSQSNNFGNFNRITLNKPVTGKFVRLVCRDAYPSNGQYYYAFADFALGTVREISGEGVISCTFDRQGGWTSDDGLVNTRTPLMGTDSGSGSKTFVGSGVILYAAKGPTYGKMMVQLDDEDPVEVDLTRSAGMAGQQPVYWREDLDTTKNHKISFYPKFAGTDRINVESVEVKGSRELYPDSPDSPATADSPLSPVTVETPLTPVSPISPLTPETAETPLTPGSPDSPATAESPDSPATADTPSTPSTSTPSTPASPSDPGTRHWSWEAGAWYLRDENNVALTGWQFDGAWYYLKPQSQGAMASAEWIWDGSGWYWMRADGTAKSGWHYEAGEWYYLKPREGSVMAAAEWVWDDGHWYWLRGSGMMYTGWFFDAGNWRYFEDADHGMPRGAMMRATWLWDNYAWYYLDGDGVMLRNAWSPDGGWLDGEGRWAG